MTDIRENAVTGRCVLIAPARSHRPLPQRPSATSAPTARCPFCPGNEADLAAIIDELPGDHPAGWLTRVVPNRYPIVSGADGLHEVIIDSPEHDARLATYPAAQLDALLATYQRRVAAAWGTPAIRAVTLFRNQGLAAGASIEHAHTQLVAFPFVAPDQARRERAWREFAAKHGRPPLRDMVARERDAGSRIVADADGFLTFVPWAAEAAFEQWVAPVNSGTGFEALPAARRAALGAQIGGAARRLLAALGETPFNMLLLAPSRELREDMPGEWCFRLIPRTTRAAGLELNTGLAITPSPPEEDAAALRALGI